MKRLFIIICFLVCLGGAGYWLYINDVFYSMHSYVENGDLLTLEMRHSAEEIMEAHRKELIGNSARVFQEPVLQFHPYLLLDVKYSDKNHRTKQGVILWSLVDGEMVLNTETWEKTQGFEDAINANATLQDFRLLNALANYRGSLTREKLQKELNLEQEPLSQLIENAKYKQLVVVKGNEVILHFENPRFNVLPQTQLASELVLKPYRQGKKLPARYTRSSIERISKAAFGSDFTIRNTQEVYLPVLRISLQNPDGSLLITDWNALTGDKIKLIKFT